MMTLEATDDLAKVLVCHQALRLHLLEDLAPAGVALLRGDLVERQWRGPSARGLRRRRALRFEECSGDLLVAGRELVECAGARRLSPRAHRDAESYDYDEHESGNVDGIPHVDPPVATDCCCLCIRRAHCRWCGFFRSNNSLAQP